MLVEKVYKGTVKEGDILTFAQGGGADCIWTYDEKWIGSRYLFYLDPPTKGHPIFGSAGPGAQPMYYPVSCGRSNSIKGAADDLAYLDKMQQVQGRTRLSGSFDTWWNEGPRFADLKIKIIGKQKVYFAKTNKDGFFEIYDLPPGDYLVQPTIPFGWKINDYMLDKSPSLTRRSEYDRIEIHLSEGIPITIKPGRHAALDLLFDVDTAISGRILSPTGKPMKGVCLMAVSTQLKEGDWRGHSKCTNEKGEFVIDEMAPDNYILVVNDDGKLSGREPFPTFFYPGVTKFSEAGVIRVDPGKYVKGIEIRAPQTVEVVGISGWLLYSDGAPVVGYQVEFKPNDAAKFGEERSQTDAEGRFSITIPKGAAGVLSAAIYLSSEKFKNCPEIEKLISDLHKDHFDYYTDPVTVAGDRSQADLTLRFPFPHCENAVK
jgi:hypothetical protein